MTCKVQRAIQLAAETKAKWFCHVDDDTFVNFEKLEKLLASFDSSKMMYVGKQSIPQGIKITNAKTIHFATGGAGWCLSKPLVSKLTFKNLVEEAKRLGLPDDVTVGALVQDLGVPMTDVNAFHSHLEGLQWLNSPENEVRINIFFKFHNNK